MEAKTKYINDSEAITDINKLLRIVECPICREVPHPPIYNCVNGHFACCRCRPKLQNQKCAYCCGLFTTMRNYPMESVVSSQLFKCEYSSYGCDKTLLRLCEYEDHVKNCWVRFVVPGKVKIMPKKIPERMSIFNSDEDNMSSCPKCHHSNPPRKLKCSDCDHNLRVPTPMHQPINYGNTLNSLETNCASI